MRNTEKYNKIISNTTRMDSLILTVFVLFVCCVSSNQICFTSVFVDFSELLYKMTMQMSESKGLSTFILNISFFLNTVQSSLSRSDTHMITHG